MSEIRVFPGITIESAMDTPVTLKLVRMLDETQEDYLQRCQKVIDLALSFVPKSQPEVINFDDRSKWRKVGEYSYERITPGN